MKRSLKIASALFLVPAVMAFEACSIKKMAYNSVSDMLAPQATAAAATKASEGPSPMTALTGENDPKLVGDFFPTALKLYEIMHLQNPAHEGLSVMTGELYVMYANAFVQQPAAELPAERFSDQNEEYIRAQNFYLRGKDYVLGALEHRYPGFRAAILGSDRAKMDAILAKCKKTDTDALYWAAAGTLGAFSLNPLDSKLLTIVPGAVAMLERTAAIDPAYGNGGVWEVLVSFYAGAPEALGGGMDKAKTAYDNALKYSGGKSPSTYITYARSFCIPAQDGAGFDEAIAKSLAIDPESQPDNRLMVVIAQRQAKWLKEHKADYILE
jgi:predicted anti-sigma-YlaC factor YlaD